MSNLLFNSAIGDLSAEAWRSSATAYVCDIDPATDAVVSGYRPLGYVDGIDLGSTPTEVELKNSMTGPNIVVASDVTGIDVTLDIILRSYGGQNITDLLYGSMVENNAPVSVVGEAVTAKLGFLVPLSGIIDDASTVVVTDAATGLITYVEGVNYTLEKTGAIRVMTTAEQTAASASDLIADDDGLLVDFDRAASQVIQGFTQSVLYRGILVQGKNNATGKYFQALFHKVKINPSDSFGLLSVEDYASTTMSGKLIASKAVSGAGLSKLFEFNKEI